jgi:hypothetical protein
VSIEQRFSEFVDFYGKVGKEFPCFFVSSLSTRSSATYLSGRFIMLLRLRSASMLRRLATTSILTSASAHRRHGSQTGAVVVADLARKHVQFDVHCSDVPKHTLSSRFATLCC